jgi:hypothetical protein
VDAMIDGAEADFRMLSVPVPMLAFDDDWARV